MKKINKTHFIWFLVLVITFSLIPFESYAKKKDKNKAYANSPIQTVIQKISSKIDTKSNVAGKSGSFKISNLSSANTSNSTAYLSVSVFKQKGSPTSAGLGATFRF